MGVSVENESDFTRALKNCSVNLTVLEPALVGNSKRIALNRDKVALLCNAIDRQVVYLPADDHKVS